MLKQNQADEILDDDFMLTHSYEEKMSDIKNSHELNEIEIEKARHGLINE